VVDWGDGTSDTITSHTAAAVTHTYPSSGTYTVKITGSLLGWQFNLLGDRLKMLNIAQWGALNISTERTFRGCSNLTATATDAPIITTTTLSLCFSLATSFNSNIGNWDVSGVSNFTSMFQSQFSFNNGGSDSIKNWDTSNATSLSLMFSLCNAFNQPIGSWNTSNVTNMNGMFTRCDAFNQPIGSWNTSNVTNMDSMFDRATNFNQDISDWNIANVTNFSTFMNGKTNLNYSAANLDLIYNKWSLQSVNPNLSISFGTIKYTASGQSGKNVLTGAPNNWTITDGGI
jgi:surface protein